MFEQKPANPPANPKFNPGTMIDKPCLIVDTNGDCWWVDPIAKTIVKMS